MKEKHIENLTRGRKSGINLGSRNVPHRLNQHEQIKFSVAIKRRYLTLGFDARPNLSNIWTKYCEAKEWPLLILHRNQDGTATLQHDQKKQPFPTPKDATQHLKSLLP